MNLNYNKMIKKSGVIKSFFIKSFNVYTLS